MSVPGDVRGGQNRDSARQIERDAKIAAVVAVNQHATDERNQQPWRGRHDHLIADLDGGMG